MTVSGSPRCARRRAGLLLVAFLLLLQLVLAPGYVDNVDSRIVLRTAERLVDAGTFGIPQDDDLFTGRPGEYGAIGPDGAFHTQFGAGNALLAVPFVVAGRAVGGLLGLGPHEAAGLVFSASAALWFALSGWLVFRLVSEVGPPCQLSVRGAVGTALAYCLCTFAVVYGRSSYLETPLTACVLAAYLLAVRVRDRPRALGPALALGAVCAVAAWIKLSSAIYLIGLFPLLFLRRPARAVRPCFVAAVPLAAGLVMLALLNDARFGSWSATGYADSAKWNRDLLGGLAALLVGERGGLLFFAPAVLFAGVGLRRLGRVDPGTAWGIGLALAASLLLHAPFVSPFGGDVWGPRYLLPNVALLALPIGIGAAGMLASGAVSRATAAAVLTLGAALNAPACVVAYTELYAFRDPVRVRQVPPAQPTLARVLVEKLRGDGATYRVDRVTAGSGTVRAGGVHRGLDLWPVRVAQRMPPRTWVAWTVWSFLLGGSVVAGWRLLGAVRR